MSWPFEDLCNHDWSIDFRWIIPWLPMGMILQWISSSRYWFRLLIFCQSSWREIDKLNCPVVDRTIQVLLHFLMMINSTDIPDSTINSTIHLFLILPMFSEFNHAFPRSKSWDSLKTSSCFSCENAPARWKSSWFFLRGSHFWSVKIDEFKHRKFEAQVGFQAIRNTRSGVPEPRVAAKPGSLCLLLPRLPVPHLLITMESPWNAF